MRKTTPGIDRVQMTELRASKAWLDGRIAAHVKQCVQCSKANGDIYARCNTWWRLKRLYHKASRKLRAQERPPEQEQMTLPGMETLC